MRNFRELKIWSEAVDLSIKIYDLCKTMPKSELYGLISQMQRCSVSIPSNIAEGCKGSNKELRHYLNISLGSSFELETQLEISHRVGYISKDEFTELVDKLNILQKKINSFKSSLVS